MNNKEKARQLGMPYGTAANKLRKRILFSLAQELCLTECTRCGEEIKEIENFTIDHIRPWLHSGAPVRLFFDLDNIAFSHLSCNCSNGSRSGKKIPIKHGTSHGYQQHSCKCDPCREWQSLRLKEYRKGR